LETGQPDAVLLSKGQQRHKAGVHNNFSGTLGQQDFSAGFNAGLIGFPVNMQGQVIDVSAGTGLKVPAVFTEIPAEQADAGKAWICP
jgi:hypothetical protein